MSSRQVRGRLRPLTLEEKQKRLERRKKKGTWAVRVWAHRRAEGKK